MTTKQQAASNQPASTEENNQTADASLNNTAPETGEEIDRFYSEQILPAEHTDDEITNNDGSIIETLDADFHDEPGYITDHSLAGSNRADYYEKRSQGKSDAEEEQAYIRNRQAEL